MKCATTANVIEFFQRYIFNTFGVPQYIHSDNGKQFLSEDMEEFLSNYGMKHIKTGFIRLRLTQHSVLIGKLFQKYDSSLKMKHIT